MGFGIHDRVALGDPFLLVDEFRFDVPREGRVRVPCPHMKLLVFLRGGGRHEVSGWDGALDIRDGDLLLAPPLTRHEYVNPDPHHTLHLQLVRMFLNPEPGPDPEPETLSGFLHRHVTRPVRIPGPLSEELERGVQALREEFETHQPGRDIRLRSICTELIIQAVRAITSPSPPPGVADGPGLVVAAVREYIRKQFAEPLTLGEIAWEAGKGEEHVARLFKRQTGQTVFQYVREVRIHHARTLLLDPSLPVSRVAERCGFRSLAHFSRTFHASVGLSPTHYRRCANESSEVP